MTTEPMSELTLYREADPKYGDNRHAELRWTVPVEEAELQAIYVKGWNDTIARAITVLIDMGLTFDQTKEFDARIRPGGAGIGGDE